MAGEQLGETAIFDWLSLDLVLGLVILCLLVVSGFFSGSETALTAASRARLHHMEREGDRKSRRALELLKHPDRLIGAILLGNNAVNILACVAITSDGRHTEPIISSGDPAAAGASMTISDEQGPRQAVIPDLTGTLLTAVVLKRIPVRRHS